jgi:hypothetical protein
MTISSPKFSKNDFRTRRREYQIEHVPHALLEFLLVSDERDSIHGRPIRSCSLGATAVPGERAMSVRAAETGDEAL